MITMDVFNDDAFGAISMTAAVDKVGYKPSYLSRLPGLYDPVPVRTTSIFIEERHNAPALIQTSPRGAPPNQKGGEKSKARAFETARIAQASRIQAHQLQNIRAFGSETEVKAVQIEVARRQFLMRQDVELTKEYHLLGMVQGKFIDADGSVIYDWASEFGQAIPAEIDFDLDAANPKTGAVRNKCSSVIRATKKNLLGLGGLNVSVHALCGDEYYDALTQHPEVIRTFENWSAAADLRNAHGEPWGAFTYGSITWHNYRGSDDGKVGIASQKARFFPMGAGIFQIAYAPAETFDFVNTLGEELYSWIVRDKDRNAWADVEMYSYPLPVCTMPQALGAARMT